MPDWKPPIIEPRHRTTNDLMPDTATPVPNRGDKKSQMAFTQLTAAQQTEEVNNAHSMANMEDVARNMLAGIPETFGLGEKLRDDQLTSEFEAAIQRNHAEAKAAAWAAAGAPQKGGFSTIEQGLRHEKIIDGWGEREIERRLKPKENGHST